MSQLPVATRSARRFTPRRIIAFAVVVAAIFILEGSRRSPTFPASGKSFTGPPAATQPGIVLRVATFNMASAVGGVDHRLDLDRTAAAIKGYDLIGLEEVRAQGWIGNQNQAKSLGELLHLPWLFAPVETRWWHDDFGNGALTDLAVLHWQRIPISGAHSDSNRNLVLLRALYRDKPLNVIITHLDRHSDHDQELQTVLDLFGSLEKPAILLGDLNTEPTDPQREKLLAWSSAIGINMDAKSAGLDWILARGLRAVHWGVTDNGASDHKLVWADLVPDSGN